MSSIPREAVERVKAKTPVAVHPAVEAAAERVPAAPVGGRGQGVQDRKVEITMDDIEGGQDQFERVLADTTPEALERRKEQIAGLTLEEAMSGEVRGGPRVAGYRDTPFSREFWGDREAPKPPKPPDPPERPPLRSD